MANAALIALSQARQLTGTEQLYAVQSGLDSRISIDQIKSYVGAGLGAPSGSYGSLQFNSTGTFGGVVINGDGTLNITNGNLVITSTVGVLFGSLATASTVALGSQVTGNLPVNNLNSGLGSGATTFWRGDGTWSAPVLQTVAPVELLVINSAIDQVISLAQAPSAAHKLFVNGLLQSQSGYTISGLTLTIPAALIFDAAFCIFHF